MKVTHKTPLDVVKNLDTPVPRRLYGRDFYVYPPKAAEQVETVYCREATDRGQLARLDDGFALNVVNSLPGYLIRTPIGGFSLSRRDPVEYEEYERNILTYKINHRAQEERLRFAARLTAHYFMQGIAPDDKIVGKLISPRSKGRKAEAIGHFNTHHNSHFRNMVMDEISDILRKKGLNEGFVVDCLVDARKIAIEQNDARALLAISREAEEYLGVKERSRQEMAPVEEVQWSHVIEEKKQAQLTESTDGE